MNIYHEKPDRFSVDLTPLKFDNRFVDNLPADQAMDNYRRQVTQSAYSFVLPTPVTDPKLIALNEKLALELGFNMSDLSSADFTSILTGNKIMPGMNPYASCYGGHQFGNWAGQLGDGRAINLGEVISMNSGHQTLQLKGAGPTPYSRNADGLAVLRSSIREFLCSEAMFHLGIPTTRALSLCTTGEEVIRDMFYNGYAKLEPGAVVCRVSSSFMRFGSFQLAAARNDFDLLKSLVDHCIQADFPELTDIGSKQTYIAWFKQVADKTCKLIVEWMRVGFVHGVMNTDNMSIIGETIDYGPYGWVDNYDPHWTPNTTDEQNKRYRFGAQADVSLWNLLQLANAIYPLINDAEPLEKILNSYMEIYRNRYREMMCRKLGFDRYAPNTDDQIIESLENLLTSAETDMTLFYRRLADLPNDFDPGDPDSKLSFFYDCYYQPESLTDEYFKKLGVWLSTYVERIKSSTLDNSTRYRRMNETNPKFVLRNYLAQQAIEKAESGDYEMIQQLMTAMEKPYDNQIKFELYAAKRPEWARNKPGCSTLSCSS